MKIKNIVFDVGNVFIYWDPYVVFEKFFDTRAQIDAFFKEIDFWQNIIEMDRGLTMHEFTQKTTVKYPHHKAAICAYDTNWLQSITGEVPGTLDLMKHLKKAGYGLYGLSNFAREKFNIAADNFEFSKHFDGLVVSSDVNEVKPQKPIYEILLKNYNLNPQECVFVDDRQENLDTAQALGFKTILFTTAQQASVDLKALGIDC